MLSHKFNIGEIVALKPAIKRNILGGIYQVTKQLPENQGELEYCIKNPKGAELALAAHSHPVHAMVVISSRQAARSVRPARQYEQVALRP